MAINIELIQFFIKRISNSNSQTFGSEVAHLFEHLEKEVKDNPIYKIYESSRIRWREWEDERDGELELPVQFEDAKYYIYDIYKRISEQGKEGYSLVIEYFPTRNSNINDKVASFNEQLLPYLAEALTDIVNANPEIEAKPKKVSGNTVFIIHGHDELLKTEVQLLLHRAGVNNIVLHELADKGRNIIEKLIEETDSANYAIALLSPDDVLNNGTKRARQNVILEIGYFLGKLGKSRVRLLKKGEVEIPTDLSGILYQNYDESGSWEIKICKELQSVGIFVDLEAIIRIH
ncbi:nucleotide-binding protein [Litoribacter alkaliphilus]|uniref:Nucleotide-binding protein n=1 Tax=Litoribacter ruber TaxID=702568 RepID=A0AAP2G2F0_9BACT|nr:nucleotide-binding protein [Litoribacter alkaliphilus]MBS9525667.1 nucleotide-binding protein [Litoribacter alkaliphilus]